MKYVLSGRVTHAIKEGEKHTLCGKFVWNFENKYDKQNSPDLLCKRCEKSLNKVLPKEGK
jgi:hypothetical protein